MAVQKFKDQQEIKHKIANYELLEEILEGIKVSVDDQKFNFEQYVKAAKAEGLQQSEIWRLAKELLGSHIALRTLYRWAHLYLTEEAFMEVRQKANLSRHNIGLLPNGDKLATDLRQQIEYQDPSVVEAYDINDVHKYSREFLIKLCQWLDSTLELNCRGK